MSTSPDSSSTDPVHWAIVIKPKKGKEAQLQSVLTTFVKRSLDDPGATGVHLIRPTPQTPDGVFMLHRSFASREHSNRFYESQMFKDYQKESADLIEGDPIMRPLHGFEAFFRATGQAPPRWKMALVTWLGVFPAVVFWSSLLSGRLSMLPSLAATALITLLVVITLAWAIMPILTRLLGFWLHPKPQHDAPIQSPAARQ